MAAQVSPHDVHEAFRETCLAKGVPELARLMGISPGVLYNKCNADGDEKEHNKPTVRDLVLAQVITGDKRITQAMARLMGGVFIDLSGTTRVSDEALLDLVAAWMKEQGELFARWQECYSDGRICADDVAKIRKEAHDVLQAVLTFVHRVEAMQT